MVGALSVATLTEAHTIGCEWKAMLKKETMVAVPVISATYPTVKGCHIPKDESALNLILDN